MWVNQRFTDVRDLCRMLLINIVHKTFKQCMTWMSNVQSDDTVCKAFQDKTKTSQPWPPKITTNCAQWLQQIFVFCVDSSLTSPFTHKIACQFIKLKSQKDTKITSLRNSLPGIPLTHFWKISIANSFFLKPRSVPLSNPTPISKNVLCTVNRPLSNCLLKVDALENERDSVNVKSFKSNDQFHSLNLKIENISVLKNNPANSQANGDVLLLELELELEQIGLDLFDAQYLKVRILSGWYGRNLLWLFQKDYTHFGCCFSVCFGFWPSGVECWAGVIWGQKSISRESSCRQ